MEECRLCGGHVPELMGHLMVDHKRTSDEAIVYVNLWVLGPDSAKMIADDIYKQKPDDIKEAWLEWVRGVCARMRERQDQIAAEALDSANLQRRDR